MSHADERREDDKRKGLYPTLRYEHGLNAGKAEMPDIRRDRGTRVGTDQRVRTRCRQSKIPGDQIPDDGAQNAASSTYS